MGAFLSLPIVGYFLLPAFGSYSTSLNLLFFYMTWSTLVLSHSPLKVEIIGSLAVRVVFFLIPSLLFLVFDSILPTLSVNIKLQEADGLPTRTGGLKVARIGKGPPQWYSVLGLSIFNICMGIAIQAGVEILFTEVLQIRSALKVTTTLPMPWSIGKHIAQGYIVREIFQYYTHRYILHAKRATLISRLHNDYHHSIRSPYSATTHFDHLVPYLLFRFLPVYLPAIIFRFHLLTYLLFLSLTTLEETLTYSGYTTIPGIMLGGFTKRQDLHMESGGRGNYAPWGFLDWVHGTSAGGDVVDDVRDEAEKHQIKERGGRALRKGGKGVVDGVRALDARRKERA